jgi:hypothetical protein
VDDEAVGSTSGGEGTGLFVEKAEELVWAPAMPARKISTSSRFMNIPTPPYSVFFDAL